MRASDVTAKIQATTILRRDDVTQAKQFIMALPIEFTSTEGMIRDFLKSQRIDTAPTIHVGGADAGEAISGYVRCLELELAVFEAARELVVAGDMIALGPPKEWRPGYLYHSPGQQSSEQLPGMVTFLYPHVRRVRSIDSYLISASPDPGAVERRLIW